MSKLLFIATIILCISELAMGFSYIWLNMYSGFSDVTSRGDSLLKTMKTAGIFSLIFSLFIVLLADYGLAPAEIYRSSIAYRYIAITWLLLFLGCIISMITVAVSKSSPAGSIYTEIKKLVSMSIKFAIIAIIISWLFH